MIVVADSGSTKTDWVFIQPDEKNIRVRTVGFNPYFQTSKDIITILEKEFSHISSKLQNVRQVYYYGAGCSSDSKKGVVKNSLETIFKNASIDVEHDMVAASRATLKNNQGIACIIGTGSNSCIWNGVDIVANIPSHGYILGDEGSGSHLGIDIVKLYLNGQMSSEMEAAFVKEFDVDQNTILENVYKGVNPNVYLASFAQFFAQHKNFPELEEIIEKNIIDFFENRIIKYPNYKNYKLGFVGSIAFHFSDIMEKIAGFYGLEISTITKCPIENLVDYHSSEHLIKI